jgi:uncharacterized protein YecA (UPF0149 family)
MDPRTGNIYSVPNKEALEKLEAQFGKLVPLTDKQAKILIPLSKRRRKALLRGMACPCASGKSFKKCCAKKIQIRKVG